MTIEIIIFGYLGIGFIISCLAFWFSDLDSYFDDFGINDNYLCDSPISLIFCWGFYIFAIIGVVVFGIIFFPIYCIATLLEKAKKKWKDKNERAAY